MKMNLRPRDSLYRATAEPTGHREAGMSFEGRPVREYKGPTTRNRGVHDFSVLKRHLKEYGYTEIGCPRCDHMRTHGTGRGCAVAHAKRCRDRIKRAMGETDSGRAELKKFTDRQGVKQEVVQDGARGPDLGLPPAPAFTPTSEAEDDLGSPAHPRCDPEATPVPSEEGSDDDNRMADEELSHEIGEHEASEPDGMVV